MEVTEGGKPKRNKGGRSSLLIPSGTLDPHDAELFVIFNLESRAAEIFLSSRVDEAERVLRNAVRGSLDAAPQRLLLTILGASSRSRVKLVRALLEKHRDRINLGSLLFNSVRHHSVAVIRELLRAGADLKFRGRLNTSCLSNAAEGGRKEAVEFLLSRGAKLRSFDAYGMTPLHWVCAYGKCAVVELLLDRGEDVDVRSRRWKRTPLQEMITYGDRKAAPKWKAVVKLLLERGADLEARDRDSETPLFIAARNSAAQTRVLLEAGANPHVAERNGWSPVAGAALSGDHEAIRRLLKYGASADGLPGVRSPLCGAVIAHSVEAIRALVGAGADIDRPDSDRSTALHCAVELAQQAPYQTLLAYGADPRIKDKRGRTVSDILRRKKLNW